jgi:hypothetical protein
MEENTVKAEAPELEATSINKGAVTEVPKAEAEIEVEVAPKTEAPKVEVEAATVTLSLPPKEEKINKVLAPEVPKKDEGAVVETFMVATKCIVNEAFELIRVVTLTQSVEGVTFDNLMACLPDLSMSGKDSDNGSTEL